MKLKPTSRLDKRARDLGSSASGQICTNERVRPNARNRRARPRARFCPPAPRLHDRTHSSGQAAGRICMRGANLLPGPRLRLEPARARSWHATEPTAVQIGSKLVTKLSFELTIRELGPQFRSCVCLCLLLFLNHRRTGRRRALAL